MTLTPEVKTFADEYKDKMIFGFNHQEEPMETEFNYDKYPDGLPMKNYLGKSVIDFDGSVGRIDENNEVHLKLNLDWFKVSSNFNTNEEYFNSLEENRGNWEYLFNERNQPVPESKERWTWFAFNGMSSHISQLNSSLDELEGMALSYEDMPEELGRFNEDGIHVGDLLTPPSNFAINTVSEYPIIEEKERLYFKDGSILDF